MFCTICRQTPCICRPSRKPCDECKRRFEILPFTKAFFNEVKAFCSKLCHNQFVDREFSK